MVSRTLSARALLLLACLSLAPLSGCAVITGFNRDWRNTIDQGSCDDLSGCWEGEWRSCGTGHHGSLKAVITRCGCSNVYEARFHATFLKVIPFEYSIPLATWQHDGVTHFKGSADLPKIAGGTYRARGTANGCRFHARYCADKDHGTFTLTRRVSCCGNGCGKCSSCSASCDMSCTESCDPTCGEAACAAPTCGQ